MDQGSIIELGDVLSVFLNPQHERTREFVSQVSDELDTDMLRSRAEGRVVRINYKGDTAYEPILYETVRSTAASFVILQGTVSRMKDTPYGQLIVELRGSQSDTDQIIAELRRRGLDVTMIL